VSEDTARGTIAVSRSVRLSEDPSPAGSGCHIFAVNPGGTDAVDLTPDSGACALDPSYSPDGSLIAYVEKLGRGSGGNSIVVMTADGARDLSISDRTYFQTGGPLIWTHDGSQIAIYYPGDFSWHVHSVADGREVETVSDLTSDRWRLPGVSPDGQFEATYCPVTDTERYAALCLTTSATSETMRLTESLGVYGGAISWSPDSVWLAFDGLNPNSESYGTYVMRRDGTGLQFIGEGSSPSWRPG
jgi:Tol biopolymer transport system component